MRLPLQISVSRDAEIKAAALAIRRLVFVEEQGVPLAEVFDDCDDAAVHVVGFADSRAVATARCLAEGNAVWRIGQVAVLRAERRLGRGTEILAAAIETIAKSGGRQIVLSAQDTAVGLYQKFGFVRHGELIRFDSGFVLVPMVLELATSGETS